MSKQTSQPKAAESAAPKPRDRVALHKGSDGVAVFFDPATNPGIKAFGALKPGVEYVVAPAEARRLAKAHRFQFCNKADAETAQAAAPDTTQAAQ